MLCLISRVVHSLLNEGGINKKSKMLNKGVINHCVLDPNVPVKSIKYLTDLA